VTPVGDAPPAGGEFTDSPFPRVTKLEPQQRDASRLNVYVDGGYAFALDGDVVAEVGLQVDAVLTDELQGRIEVADQRRSARARALRFLGHRERSRAEVARRLLQDDYPAALVEEVGDWLEGLGYVDDRRYAAAFARHKRTAGWGARRIASELERQGVDRDIARCEAAEPADEDASTSDGSGAANSGQSVAEDRLIALVSRRFGTQLVAGDEGAGRRAGAFLARRGHEWQTIRRVLDAVKSTDPDGEEPPDLE
jgi:SOS response regulatory protein OraA/RecX